MKNKYEILIVDDIQANLQLLAKMLTESGYKVRSALDGELALMGIEAKSPDLILLDIKMPGMNGYEVACHIKANPKTATIPIIFLSALGETKDKIRAFESGAVDYITKPFDGLEVLARVRTQLELLETKDTLIKNNGILKRQHEIIDRNILISSIDLQGKITYISEAFCKLSGYTNKELLGNSHKIICSPETVKSKYNELWQIISSNACWFGELKNIKKNGSIYWVDAFIEPLYNENNSKVGYFSIFEDISSKKQIEIISITDALTNLYNRRYFEHILSKELSRGCRENKSLTFSILDVDYFKQYNDTYGHKAGDDVLIAIGKVLKKTMGRASDYVFRLGGEEFGIIFSDMNEEESYKIVDKVRQAIESLRIPHKENSVSPWVTISAGFVVKKAKDDAVDKEEIYKIADQALYKAKEKGRNRIIVYSKRPVK